MNKSKGILSAIGNTPLIKLEKIYPGLPLHFYAKLEMLNPGGSMKDRPAYLMLSEAIQKGTLKKNDTVIESSSGNMAVGLAQVCRYLELNLIIVVDPKINRHTLQILKAYGARIEKVKCSEKQENYLLARLDKVKELLNSNPGYFWPNQYENRNNSLAHHRTMDEIIHALSGEPDYILAATSTCGTIMGCAEYIKKHNLHTKIVAVDAVGSVLFGLNSSKRMIPGYGAGKKSELLDENYIDHVLHITDNECIEGCRTLLKNEAILAGGSSGAVVSAAKKLQHCVPENSDIVMILADSGERYLDTIYNDKWVKQNFSNFDIAEKSTASPITKEEMLSVE